MKKFLEIGMGISLCLMAVLLVSCGKVPLVVTGPLPILSIVNGSSSELAVDINDFGFDMLRRLDAGSKTSTIISPLSLHEVLAMTAQGAVGNTKSQMDTVLRLDKITNVSSEYGKLNQSLNSGRNVELTVANSLWLQTGFPMSDEFKNAAAAGFDAQLSNVDFPSGAAAQQINGWVDEKTKGLITNIVPAGPSGDVLNLVNAVYFKGKWQEPFEPARPYGTFNIDGKVIENIPVIGDERQLKYFENSDFQMTQLDYEGGEFSMLVLLPNKNSSLDKLISTIDGAKLKNAIDGMSDSKVRLVMPTIKFEWSGSVVPNLQNMGMTDAFNSGSADFSKLSTKPLFISSVIHKTYFLLDSEGTEAAAASSVGMAATAMPPQPEKIYEMIVDRPYLLVLLDNRSGTAMFLSAIHNPLLQKQ